MKPCDRAWCVLAGGVVVYDLLASPGQTLSEGVDRYLRARPRGTRLAIAVLVIHIANVVPNRYDPLHWLFVVSSLKHKGGANMSAPQPSSPPEAPKAPEAPVTKPPNDPSKHPKPKRPKLK